MSPLKLGSLPVGGAIGERQRHGLRIVTIESEATSRYMPDSARSIEHRQADITECQRQGQGQVQV